MHYSRMSTTLAPSAVAEAPAAIEAVIRFTDPASAGAVLHHLVHRLTLAPADVEDIPACATFVAVEPFEAELAAEAARRAGWSSMHSASGAASLPR